MNFGELEVDKGHYYAIKIGVTLLKLGKQTSKQLWFE